MIIYEKQRKILKLFIRDVDNFIEEDNINGLLHELHAVYMTWGFNMSRGRYNWLGRKLHKLCIEILLQNRKE